MNIAWAIAHARETLLWLILYMYYSESNKAEHTNVIIELYITEIMHLADHYISPVSEIIKEIYLWYYMLIEKWISIDDNSKYMQLALNNWNKFTNGLQADRIKNNLIGEDIMRLRWFIKNISYYNKRFVIPK